MIVKIAAGGASFVGAGRYYLGPGRDKKDERGIADYMIGGNAGELNSRVAFSEVLNLAESHPWSAFTKMQETYSAYRVAEATKRGRKLTEPVYSYSLSWSPEENPSREEMLKAAKESLKVVGLDKHQVVLVAHNDQPHKHIHVIANRVDLAAGKAAHMGHDYLKLSKWAEDYEKQNGRIFCERRIEHNRARAAGEFVKDRQNTHRGFKAKEIDEAAKAKVDAGAINRAAKLQERAAKRDDLFRSQAEERASVYNTTRHQLSQETIRTKEAHKAQWVRLYADQRAERKEIKSSSSNVFERACYVFSNRERMAMSGISGIRQITKSIVSRQEFLRSAERILQNDRIKLSQQQSQSYRGGVQKIWVQHRARFDTLRRSQQGKRTAILGAYKTSTKQGNQNMGIVKDAVGAVAEGYIKTLATAADVAAKSYFGDQVQGEPPIILHINEQKEKMADRAMAQEAKDLSETLAGKQETIEPAANDSPKMSKEDFIAELKRIKSETSIVENKDQQRTNDKSDDFER
jgi:hypothetical protein